jgi:hypothetical protein
VKHVSLVEIRVEIGYPVAIEPIVETKVYRSKKKKPIRLKVMLASFVTAPDNLYGASSKLSFASSNVEPAHNTTKYFVPNLR